jgi:F0F1-type ATP synthase assembly protein I
MFKNYLIFKINSGFNLFFLNFIFLLLFSICLIIFFDHNYAVSCFLGGFISIFSSFLFFIIYFYNNKNSSYRTIVKRFYIAGIIKFLSFISLCFLSFLIGVGNVYVFLFCLFFFQFVIWVFFIFFFNGM